MTTISRTLAAAVFALSVAWFATQAKAVSAPLGDGSTRTKATAESTQAPKAQAPKCKDQNKLEAITVSVTPFLKSADPHPLPALPKRKPKSQTAKVRASR